MLLIHTYTPCVEITLRTNQMCSLMPGLFVFGAGWLLRARRTCTALLVLGVTEMARFRWEHTRRLSHPDTARLKDGLRGAG